MSEFTNNKQKRLEKLTEYMLSAINSENTMQVIKKYDLLNAYFIPNDFVEVFDILLDKGISIDKMKPASNKMFNLFFKTITANQTAEITENEVLNFFVEDNKAVKKLLKNTSVFIKQINSDTNTLNQLINSFEELQKFTAHYTVKENILFPEIEKNINNFACLKLMWSFHDDIRKNIKKTLEILNNKEFKLKEFNRHSSLVYFNINTIIFREEYILFPLMMSNLDKSVFEKMQNQISEQGLLYVKVPQIDIKTKAGTNFLQLFSTESGELNFEQIDLIFKYLPVDITFVDENDKVRFFSTPKHRIFPRSNGIIGRMVQNCHPHESVETVNKIIESFKKFEKEKASFWIHMGQYYVLIQYFALINARGEYKGVLEVSQEISEIQKITGERKLLDW